MSGSPEPKRVGPVLYARGVTEEGCRLAALVVQPDGETPPRLLPMGEGGVEAVPLDSCAGDTVWRYDFTLPARADAYYEINGDRFPVACDFEGDVRIAFVSCNGQEHGDKERDLEERNVMWRRLAEQHKEKPYNLLLQGGDQIYADDVVRSHPDIEAWFRGPVEKANDFSFNDEAKIAAEEFLFTHYKSLSEQPDVAWMTARVPSLMMWDDHDIVDGWGSRPKELLDSPIGRGLFANARRMFCLFQLGAKEDEPPSTVLEQDGKQYTLAANFPGFSIIAPDLRSERRPNRVMGQSGWAAWNKALTACNGNGHTIVMSTVPVLGPRLSWVEQFFHRLLGMQKYEDDLRDQWQSRHHREEWKRFLKSLEDATEASRDVTVVSGEIHLATRAEMGLKSGKSVHQLVASGIAHPAPPNAYARCLGALARLGADPLPGRPIKLHPLPGHKAIYVNQRNYLKLTRENGKWRANWELEESGTTDPLYL